MVERRGERLTLRNKSNALLVSGLGVGMGVLLGLVVVDEALKMLLLCLGAVFLVLGVVFPRLIMYVLVVLVACISETTYGVQAHGVFRLAGYTLDPMGLNIYEILTYCLFFIAAARRALRLMPRGVPGWITIPCLVSALVVLLQLARALLAGTPYRDAVHVFSGRYILVAVAALWCFTELLGERSVRLRLLDLLYVCAAGRSIYALFRFFLAGGDTANAYRASVVKIALYEYADHLLFLFLISVVVAGWATGRVAGTRLAFWASGSVVMALTVALSYRRIGWFGLAASLILPALLLLRRNQRSMALVAAALVVLGGIAAASYSRFHSGGGLLARLFPDVVTRVGPTRQDEWALAWQTIVRNPIAGELTARRTTSRLVEWDTRFVHNAFLFAWMKLGLAGLVSLCFLGGTCVVYAIHGVRMRGPEEHISLGVLGIVPFTLALAMFEQPLIQIRPVLVLALAGALAVLGAGASGERNQQPNADECPNDSHARIGGEVAAGEEDAVGRAGCVSSPGSMSQSRPSPWHPRLHSAGGVRGGAGHDKRQGEGPGSTPPRGT